MGLNISKTSTPKLHTSEAGENALSLKLSGGIQRDGAGDVVLGLVDGAVRSRLPEKTKVGHLADLAGSHQDVPCSQILYTHTHVQQLHVLTCGMKYWRELFWRIRYFDFPPRLADFNLRPLVQPPIRQIKFSANISCHTVCTHQGGVLNSA